MTKERIIVDTDVGMDDIIAISMLTENPKYEIIGLTTVFGLTSSEVGQKNLLRILRYLGYSSEVVRGADNPLSGEKYSFPPRDVKNSTELTFLKDMLPTQSEIQETSGKSAETYLYESVIKSQGRTLIVCLGPLTNIAQALKKYGDDFAERARLAIMGGAVLAEGNVSPQFRAEYNIYLDVEAANRVFSNNIPILLVPIDATRFVPATEEFKQVVRETNPTTRVGRLIREVIVSNEGDFRYFYDPLVAAILEDARILKEKRSTRLEVSTEEEEFGRTEPSEQPASKSNIEFVTNVDNKRFINLMMRKML